MIKQSEVERRTRRKLQHRCPKCGTRALAPFIQCIDCRRTDAIRKRRVGAIPRYRKW